MGIKCCYGCVPPKRTPTCHITCPEYIEEKAAHDAKRLATLNIVAIKRGLNDQRSESIDKAMRHHGRKLRDSYNK